MSDTAIAAIALFLLIWSVGGTVDWLMWKRWGIAPNGSVWLNVVTLMTFGPLVWALMTKDRLKQWRSKTLKRFCGTDRCGCGHRH